jgi:hypothetical protein
MPLKLFSSCCAIVSAPIKILSKGIFEGEGTGTLE